MKPFRPSILAFLLVLAAAVNAGGYLFSLWHDETVFDEAVHLYTSFAVMAAIGSALVRTRFVQASPPRLFWSLIAAGLVIGLIWEGFEWLIGIIGGRTDTLMDLAMDVAGAAIAAALIRFSKDRASGSAIS